MVGLFHGKPYFQMDDLGGFPIIFGNTHFPLVHPGWFFNGILDIFMVYDIIIPI